MLSRNIVIDASELERFQRWLQSEIATASSLEDKMDRERRLQQIEIASRFRRRKLAVRNRALYRRLQVLPQDDSQASQLRTLQPAKLERAYWRIET